MIPLGPAVTAAAPSVAKSAAAAVEPLAASSTVSPMQIMSDSATSSAVNASWSSQSRRIRSVVASSSVTVAGQPAADGEVLVRLEGSNVRVHGASALWTDGH